MLTADELEEIEAELSQRLAFTLKHSIAEELLRELDPNITQDKVQEIWNLCKGNPWNAPVIFNLLKGI